MDQAEFRMILGIVKYTLFPIQKIHPEIPGDQGFARDLVQGGDECPAREGLVSEHYMIELSAQAHKREKRARTGLGQSARPFPASGTAR